MAKSKSDISLGGAEQNMSREELAAVTKAVATLSPEDRDLLAAVQESPFRLYWSPMSRPWRIWDGSIWTRN